MQSFHLCCSYFLQIRAFRVQVVLRSWFYCYSMSRTGFTVALAVDPKYALDKLNVENLFLQAFLLRAFFFFSVEQTKKKEKIGSLLSQELHVLAATVGKTLGDQRRTHRRFPRRLKKPRSLCPWRSDFAQNNKTIFSVTARRCSVFWTSSPATGKLSAVQLFKNKTYILLNVYVYVYTGVYVWENLVVCVVEKGNNVFSRPSRLDLCRDSS